LAADQRYISYGKRTPESAAHRESRAGYLATAILGALIRDERNFENHVDYIHFNLVKHGHVTRVIDWLHSSFYRYFRAGLDPAEWAGTHDSLAMERE